MTIFAESVSHPHGVFPWFLGGPLAGHAVHPSMRHESPDPTHWPYGYDFRTLHTYSSELDGTPHAQFPRHQCVVKAFVHTDFTADDMVIPMRWINGELARRIGHLNN